MFIYYVALYHNENVEWIVMVVCVVCRAEQYQWQQAANWKNDIGYIRAPASPLTGCGYTNSPLGDTTLQ